jgi:hypothetical protein
MYHERAAKTHLLGLKADVRAGVEASGPSRHHTTTQNCPTPRGAPVKALALFGAEATVSG